jgi:hypothetical protein
MWDALWHTIGSLSRGERTTNFSGWHRICLLKLLGWGEIGL